MGVPGGARGSRDSKRLDELLAWSWVIVMKLLVHKHGLKCWLLRVERAPLRLSSSFLFLPDSRFFGLCFFRAEVKKPQEV